MIADSKYEVRGLVLGPLTGFAVGAAGGFLMIGALWLLHPLSGLEPGKVLADLAGLVLGSRHRPGTSFIVGLAIVSLTGAVCGTLYAMSQQLAPSLVLLATGVSYGVLLWAVGGNIVVPLMAAELSVLTRTWVWLLACLVYGVWVSGVAALSAKKRSRNLEIVQPD
ncbi:MAG TPA: hypothetical protein VJO34_04795 [Methylomirabilota bacterium]|nr:hypothetical protein [Methylomirabilota bacterium]